MSKKKEVSTEVKKISEPENPFLKKQPDHLSAGAVAIEQERATAEAQGKLVLAKKFPRDESQAFDKLMNSCGRIGIAEAATYSYPRGKKTVTGPSIRLAEELARCYGNIDYGIRELSQRSGESEMEAYCWDMETNVISSQKFTVKHELHTTQGIKKLTDPRDIYEIGANNGARRLRARILAVMPPDMVDAALQKCKKTMTEGAAKNIQEKVNQIKAAFKNDLNIDSKHLEEKLGYPLSDITPEDYVELRGIYGSIKSGQTKRGEWFSAFSTAEKQQASQDIANLNKQIATRKQKSESTESDQTDDDNSLYDPE